MDSLEEIYLTEYTRKYTAINLISFGYFQYKQAVITKNISYLRDNFKNIPSIIHDDRFKEIISNNLIDNVRILILIENYLKAFLLSHNYICHKISQKDEFKSLRNKQNTEPIDIVLIEEIQKETTGLILPSQYAEQKTVQIYSLLYKEKYKSLFKLPKQIIDLADRCRISRNRLHFYNGDINSISETFLIEYEYLEKFVNEVIVLNHNSLCKILNAPKHHYLNNTEENGH